MSGLLSISLTGLNAAQAALNTTSNNIANANVTGYNRQQVVQTTADPLFTGAGFFGQGTEISTVRRIYSQFLSEQVLAADTSRVQYDTYYNQIKQVDNLLSDATAGLSPALEEFFRGVQQVAADPSSVPSRQSMLSTSEALATRFQAMDARFQEIRGGVETQIGQAVNDINTLAKQISSLNNKIVSAQAAGPNVPANDLLDKRDAVVAQLNQQISATATTNLDGTLNVFIGSGQPLVMGSDVFKLSTTASTTDSSRFSVGIKLLGGGVVPIPENLLSGGVLGGLLGYRSDSLDSAQNALGRIALSLVTGFNAQHALGQDLDGQMGGNYFTALAPAQQNLPNLLTSAPSAATITTTVSSVAGLTTDDYVLAYDGTNYALTRTSDSGVVYSGATLPINVGGLTITGTMTTAGDRVLIQPTRNAARDISVTIKDTRLIAAASPVRSSAANTNTGTGAVTQPVANSLTGILASPAAHIATPITLSFDSTLNQFNVTGATPATIAYNPTSNAVGTSITLTNPNLNFSISGRPANGDTFTITTNVDGTKDGRNANALYSLQSAKDLLGGTATLGYAYSQLVSDVGSKTNEAKVNADAQQGLLDQATATQQGLSGVSLDEEAANLLRFQQIYQASARSISVANSLFEDILAIMK
ncbi:flagellar hook-associated protein FlgK [Uliginosibacterium sp. 31-16]|uniref:flagellar hook-associated protein FlgK n=1 Tax=Uliginosibacterium sp. 31-16 TaxID=3068315 RepID=UPI00273D6DB6|nr:flagellar hook-associated protein FlgK [Uliginosibacterium sp. 31-16]MDP5239494.1 flagellar hook-associated protein FlgK [Uliginosibacterium sp. 31-16]